MGEETTTTIQTGKGSGAERRETCLKGENKVRGWGAWAVRKGCRDEAGNRFLSFDEHMNRGERLLGFLLKKFLRLGCRLHYSPGCGTHAAQVTRSPSSSCACLHGS